MPGSRPYYGLLVIAKSEATEAIHTFFAARWIASLFARNDGIRRRTVTSLTVDSSVSAKILLIKQRSLP
jgi:hypothetical protein